MQKDETEKARRQLKDLTLLHDIPPNPQISESRPVQTSKMMYSDHYVSLILTKYTFTRFRIGLQRYQAFKSLKTTLYISKYKSKGVICPKKNYNRGKILTFLLSYMHTLLLRPGLNTRFCTTNLTSEQAPSLLTLAYCMSVNMRVARKREGFS